MSELAMDKLAGYFQIKEAAETVGVSSNTLRRWGYEGKICTGYNPTSGYR